MASPSGRSDGTRLASGSGTNDQPAVKGRLVRWVTGVETPGRTSTLFKVPQGCDFIAPSRGECNTGKRASLPGNCRLRGAILRDDPVSHRKSWITRHPCRPIGPSSGGVPTSTRARPTTERSTCSRPWPASRGCGSCGPGRPCGGGQRIARDLGLPPSTVAMHVAELEQAGLISCELRPASRGLRKRVRTYDEIVVGLPRGDRHARRTYELSMPVEPTRTSMSSRPGGARRAAGLIGLMDDPASFDEPDRLAAQLVWFRAGYVEYRFPNRVPPGSVISKRSRSPPRSAARRRFTTSTGRATSACGSTEPTWGSGRVRATSAARAAG